MGGGCVPNAPASGMRSAGSTIRTWPWPCRGPAPADVDRAANVPSQIGRGNLVRHSWFDVPHGFRGVNMQLFVDEHDGAWTSNGHQRNQLNGPLP